MAARTIGLLAEHEAIAGRIEAKGRRVATPQRQAVFKRFQIP